MSEFDNPEIYRAILETLPTAVYLVDRNRKILFWNAGAEDISGYLRQDVVGRFLRDHLLTANEDVKDMDANPFDPLSLAFRDGKPSTAHVSILHKQGYRVPIVLQTVPIRNERGGIIGVAECFERNITASERTRRQIPGAELGCIDAMIGIPTRTFMETQVREQLTLYAERHVPFAILLMQVDQLDQARAARGPSAVPAMLRVVAQTIENSLRPTDAVGCWSENQFLALLMQCRATDVESVANRIRKMIAQSEVEWWGDKFSVTASLGGAGIRVEDTPEMLVERAEKSLAQSIVAGGNLVTVAV
jgi:diguanylate cyclase (GGDEF)-like protein/PAS domain S-box-containing protein